MGKWPLCFSGLSLPLWHISSLCSALDLFLYPSGYAVVLDCCLQFHTGGTGQIIAVHHRLFSVASGRICGALPILPDHCSSHTQYTANRPYVVSSTSVCACDVAVNCQCIELHIVAWWPIIKWVPVKGERSFSLPSQHCKPVFILSFSFNQLCLPTYDSYEEVHKMLQLAISEGCEGFGMLWLLQEEGF